MRGADPVELAIFHSAFHSIAERWGRCCGALDFHRTSRNAATTLVPCLTEPASGGAWATNMPVHLDQCHVGSCRVDAPALERGDMAILNDPYAGGTHLPDITAVLPVFAGSHERLRFTSRAAHTTLT